MNPLFWPFFIFAALAYFSTILIGIVPKRRTMLALGIVVFFTGCFVGTAVCVFITGGPNGNV